MRVLITGISGFVGSRLAPCLAAHGDRVTGTYSGARPCLAGVDLFEADLLDPASLARAVEAADPETVIHLAGLSHVGESWQRIPDYFRVNVLGTENLLAAVGGRRVLLASSAEVYGLVPEDEQPISEERSLDPRTPYALTKATAERLAAGAGAVIVRAFNLVGPGQSTRFALPSFAAQLAAIAAGRSAPVLRVGNLEARRDFVHVDDGAEAYRILAADAEPGTIYNLGSGEALPIRATLDELLAVSGVEVRIEEDRERLRPADLPLLQADNRRLLALGWQAERGLRRALEDLWRSALAEEERGSA